MFGWLWNRIGDAVVSKIEDWLQEPKNIEQLTNLVDSLFDREVKRLMSSLGGSQKSGSEQIGETGSIDLQSLLTGKGGLSSKKLVALGVNWWMNKQKGQQGTNQGSLP